MLSFDVTISVATERDESPKTFLRAFCELRQEERLFRLDRILEVEEIGDIFEITLSCCYIVK